MAEIEVTNFREIKFTRDTKVDYKSGNPIINCIFRQFDANGDEKFDDEEWANYQKYEEKIKERQQKLEEFERNNNKVILHYERKLDKIHKKTKELDDKLKKIITPNWWEELIKFEERHPSVSREGYTNKTKLPEGVLKYDISSFEMGIYDEENKCFKEETYKTGYLKGLETLSEDEKKEYLSLLDKASKMIAEFRKIEKEYECVDKEEEKLLAMIDMAQNGIVDKIGSDEYENEMYQQYTQIRSEANPFFIQIKEIEAKYNLLSKKVDCTEKEDELLEQYKIQLQQLRQASASWSISDNAGDTNIKNSGGFQITDFSEKGTYSKNSKDEKITDSHTIGVMYSDANWNVTGNFTKAEIYTIEPESGFENTYTAFLNGSYSKKHFSVSSTSNFSFNKTSMNIMQEFSAKLKNWGVKVSENIMKNKQDEETTTTTSTTAGISYQAGKFENNANVTFAEEGTTYELSSSGNFGIKPFKGVNLTLAPSASTSFNENTKTTTLNPQLSTNFRYNHKNFSADMRMSESWTRTLQNGSAPIDNNSFNINGGVAFKGFSTRLKFNDMVNPSSHSNTYGTEISYDNSNVGKFSAEYSYQKSKSKMPQGKDCETSTVSFSYTAPLETINKWFKKRKSH